MQAQSLGVALLVYIYNCFHGDGSERIPHSEVEAESAEKVRYVVVVPYPSVVRDVEWYAHIAAEEQYAEVVT